MNWKRILGESFAAYCIAFTVFTLLGHFFGDGFDPTWLAVLSTAAFIGRAAALGMERRRVQQETVSG